MDAALRRYCQKRKAALLAERQPQEADWKQVAEYIDPYAGRHLSTSTGTTTPQKLPSRAKIINSAAGKALRTMDSGFMGGHTSKSRAWFRLGVSDPKLADNEEVKIWLDDETQAIRDTLARSNFYTALPGLYHSRHLFGIGSMVIDEDDEDTVRFYTRAIGTYAIGLDRRGRCDTYWYRFRYTAHQIKQEFEPIVGLDGLPERVRDALRDNRLDDKFWIECLVEPNPDFKPGARGPLERKVRAVYWIEGSNTDTHGCLDQQGYNLMRVLAPRWGADGNDAYGPSPSIEALGDIKQLQYLEGEKLRLIDLTSKPPMALPESLRHKSGSLSPGSKTYVTPDQTQQKVEAIYTPDARALMQVMAEIDKVKERIDQAYFADLFRMLDYLDDRERTAFEISERKEEKVAMLGPALETLTDELLDPCIEIIYADRLAKGLVKPIPEVMNNVPIKVEYTSILAQAQKAAGIGTVERILAIVGQTAEAKQDPSVWDKVNVEASIEIAHDMLGGPARMLNSDDQVAALQQGRAQQQKMAQMAQLAPAMKDGAAAMKTLGEAVPQDGSAASAMADMGMPA